MNKLCTGCNVIEGCGLINYILKDIACPCFECLIKVMCTEACKNFHDFEEKCIVKMDNEIRKTGKLP